MNKRMAKILYHLAATILFLSFLIVGITTNTSFNEEKHMVDYTSDELFGNESSLNSSDALEVKLFESTSATYVPWETYVGDNPEEENNFKSKFYEFSISNVCDYAVTSYKIKFEAKAESYMVAAWCGTYEFHQVRNGSEKVQIIDFTNKPESLDDYIVETVHDDFLVTMMQGDYFYYFPTAEGFAPISVGNLVKPGFIVVESMTNPSDFKVSAFDIVVNDSSSSTQNKGTDVEFGIVSRGDVWLKTIDFNNEGLTDPNFLGQTFDIQLKNKTGDNMDQFSIKFVADSTMYIASCWNGAIEIHQGDTTETIPDLRKYTFKDTKLDTIEAGIDKLIVLNKGDFFIYHPSSQFDEIPLASNGTVRPGMIIYQPVGEALTVSVEITYSLERNILLNPFFDIAVIGLLGVLLSAIFNILLHNRVSGLVKQREHDEKIIVESIETFIGFIDAKDPYTNGHSHRVAQYTRLLAENMGIGEEEVKRIYYIALLHDCGKIGIPDSILSKPAKLTLDEFEVIKKHPALGAEILKNFTSIEGVRDGVLYHHERYDGTGYPTGKKGKDIPLEARLICVADSVDAMSSDRCYRSKLTKDEILDELRINRGTQFDPDAVDAMIELITYGKIKV